jgi:hypothetical protein
VRTRAATLWRALPPFRLRVTVHQISVVRFLHALRVCHDRAHVLRERGVTDPMSLMQALGDRDFCAAIADLLCPDERPRFLTRWFSAWNARHIMRASIEAEGWGGWERITGIIDWDGARKKGRPGGLQADVADICRIYPSLMPTDIMRGSMQDFLDLCDFVEVTLKAERQRQIEEDPTLNPDVEPTPLRGAPGAFGAVH